MEFTMPYVLDINESQFEGIVYIENITWEGETRKEICYDSKEKLWKQSIKAHLQEIYPEVGVVVKKEFLRGFLIPVEGGQECRLSILKQLLKDNEISIVTAMDWSKSIKTNDEFRLKLMQDYFKNN